MTNIFLIHIQLPIFSHFLQMLPDSDHTSSLSLIHSCIELKLAGRGRWHFSLEWLRNPLSPTSNHHQSLSFLPSCHLSHLFLPLYSHCHYCGSGLNWLLLGWLLQQPPSSLPTSGFSPPLTQEDSSSLPTVFITPLLQSL